MLRFHLAEDTIDRHDVEDLIRWLRSGPRLTKDKLTVEFEEKWAVWAGTQYAVFCNSGSSANLLMFYALLISGRLRNKKVIVPATGWVTSVAPAIQFGLEPIMCDSDPDTFGLDLNCLESLLQKHKPGAVMLVQVLGVPHKMPELLALKEKYGFLLMEDACAAVGSQAYGQKLGSFGDLGSYSLYFGHQASTIEGGVVVTRDKKFYELLLMLRSHGWSKDLDESAHERLVTRHGVDDFQRPFVFYEPGFNLRPTDLNAFIGLGQLKKIDAAAKRRDENHRIYRELLGDVLRIQKWFDPQAIVSSIHFAAVAETSEQRKMLLTALAEEKIETRIFSASNLGRHPFWSSRFGVPSAPAADAIYRGGFFLPNHPSLAPEDVRFICNVILSLRGVAMTKGQR